MRYNEAALEVFGLISKMKDANEPVEYIKEQLRGMVTEIIVPMTDDDEGKPYLMQLTEELELIKRGMVVMMEQVKILKTENDGLRRELAEARWEASTSTNQLAEQLINVSQQMTTENDGLRRELLEGQREIAVTVAEDRIRRVDERLTERRIGQQLRAEAQEAWNAKPETERMRKAGLFRKEEDVAARDRFIQKYVDDHYEQRIRETYEG